MPNRSCIMSCSTTMPSVAHTPIKKPLSTCAAIMATNPVWVSITP
ncbi:Uncharacterised protein [Vibrio cholerae]|nr:Uncharacterised protein [Vibrio cholerae]